MAQLIQADFSKMVTPLTLLGTGFAQGQQIGAQFANQRALAQQAEQQAQLSGLQQQAATGDAGALEQVAGIDPQAAAGIQKFLATKTETERAKVLEENERMTRRSGNALALPPEERRAFIQREIESMEAQVPPIDTSRTRELVALPDDQFNQALEQQVRRGLTIQQVVSGAFPAPLTIEQQQKQQEIDIKQSAEERLAKESAQVGVIKPLPSVLLEGLTPDVAEKASAAFTAAGGGDKGLRAYARTIDNQSERERRSASPAIIKSSFPNATAAETVQLQATMDAAKNTESGLKAVQLVRTEQKRASKAKDFQVRGIALLDSILANDQLGDVLGSIEGRIDLRFSDVESELIADITNVGDILTADNLSLMSGVLSESDIQILRNLAAGGLNRTRTEERFRKDVQTIRDKLSSQLVVTVDDISADRQTDQVPEGTTANNAQGETIVMRGGQWQAQ